MNSRVIDRKNFWRIIDLSVTVEMHFQLKSTNIASGLVPKILISKTFSFFIFCFAIDKWHNISGETFGLKGTEPKQFLYDVKRISAVYGYDDIGNKIYFSADDYDVDLNHNTIARTVNSSMPDFANYTVNFNKNGTFTFNSELRNSPLCRQFQIYADYIANENLKTISLVYNSFFENKPNEFPKIAVFGDSIANAAQTTAQYFLGTDAYGFVGLLRTFLQTEYGIKNVIVDNFSKTDMSIDLLVADKEKVIDGNYNTVIIEYGMNDHLSGVREGPFKEKLENLCAYFSNNSIYIIIVGFFQQNEKWDLEKPVYPGATVEFNNILKSVAKKYNAPFIGIYSEFQKISQRKDLIEDLTVDWMHHPTDFGHKVYFSMMVPYFINSEVS